MQLPVWSICPILSKHQGKSPNALVCCNLPYWNCQRDLPPILSTNQKKNSIHLLITIFPNLPYYWILPVWFAPVLSTIREEFNLVMVKIANNNDLHTQPSQTLREKSPSTGLSPSSRNCMNLPVWSAQSSQKSRKQLQSFQKYFPTLWFIGVYGIPHFQMNLCQFQALPRCSVAMLVCDMAEFHQQEENIMPTIWEHNCTT